MAIAEPAQQAACSSAEVLHGALGMDCDSALHVGPCGTGGMFSRQSALTSGTASSLVVRWFRFLIIGCCWSCGTVVELSESFQHQGLVSPHHLARHGWKWSVAPTGSIHPRPHVVSSYRSDICAVA
jgi:hypothetical protein